ncbi:MAG: YfhO family protein [Clostridia bacterium]|nr:YfhO family protein [Clostridia bacterium]
MTREETAVTDSASSDAELCSPDCPKNRLGRFFEYLKTRRYSYLFYCFIIPFVLYYLIYLSMGLHPFGNGSVLVLDLNGQYVYFYEALRNAVYGETSLVYSFCRTLGGEFFGIYAYYLASPFSYIVCLFPQDRMLEALLFIFLLKSGLSGVTMGYYLDRISSKPRKINIVIFSVLYAMCSYAVVQQHNSMWIDSLIFLPLLTLGIEELIKHSKYRLYVSMLALILLSNFYIGYMCCIYTLIYFFYYYFSRNEDGRNNPTGEPFHFRRSLLRIAGFSALAIGISMIIVATAYYSLQFGKNTFSNPDFSFEIRFDIMDFFTKFLPGSYDTVRPEGLPLVYSGILTLYCVPVYFFSKKFSVREKIFSAAILFLFFLCFSINTVDMIWHGFQKPNWLNYRYSFMVSFLMLVMGFKGFGELKKTGARVIGLLCVIYVIFLSVVQKFKFHAVVERIGGKTEFDQPLEELETVWISLLFFIVVAALLCIAVRSKRSHTMSLIICIVTCVEAFAGSLVTAVEFGNDVIYSSYSSYNDFIKSLRPLTTEIVETDTGFYRYEKNAHRKYCDNMALNIRGITNSTSTLNKSTIEFLEKMGYASKSHWSKYLGGNPVNDSLIGIKYIIAKQSDDYDVWYSDAGFNTATYNSDEYMTYLNPYALSLSYAVDEGTSEFNMSSCSTPQERLNALVKAMTGDESLEMFTPLEYSADTTNCTVSTIAGHWKYVHTNSEADAILIYTFKAVEDGEVYFYLPSDYAREVRMKIGGRSLGNFYGGETTRIFSLGSFKKGEDIVLSMTLDADVLYVKQDVDPLYQLNRTDFETAMSILSKEQVEIGEGWKPTKLEGSVTTSSDDRLMLTTLPYDEGWKVYVDGKQTEIEKVLGALIAYRIPEAGEHTVVFKYSPRCYVLGNVISVLSLILFILIMIFEKPLKAVWAQISRQSGRSDDDLLPEERAEAMFSHVDPDPGLIDMYGSNEKRDSGSPASDAAKDSRDADEGTGPDNVGEQLE